MVTMPSGTAVPAFGFLSCNDHWNSRWPTIPIAGRSGITLHERTDSCLGLCIRWSEPEEMARCGQFDECGSGDGAGVVLCMGESDTGIMA